MLANVLFFPSDTGKKASVICCGLKEGKLLNPCWLFRLLGLKLFEACWFIWLLEVFSENIEGDYPNLTVFVLFWLNKSSWGPFFWF